MKKQTKPQKINLEINIKEYTYSLGWEQNRSEVGIAIEEEVIEELLQNHIEEIDIILKNGIVRKTKTIYFMSGNHIEGYWVIPYDWTQEVENGEGIDSESDESQEGQREICETMAQ